MYIPFNIALPPWYLFQIGEERSNFQNDSLSCHNVPGAGEYDYDDSDDLPAGCQYVDWQSSDTVNSNSSTPSAVWSTLTSSGANGSARASAPGSALGATAAPIQAEAQGAYSSKGAPSSATSSYGAPALAPDKSPRNATLASLKQAALQSGINLGRQGFVKMLCKPIAARGDPPHRMSKSDKVFLGVCVSIPVTILIIGCVAVVRHSNNKPH